jgi:hypothetical protein
MGITGLVWINDGEHNRAVSPDKVASMEGWVRGRLGVKGHPKTHCKRGHEYTPETTRPLIGGRRACLLCEKEHHQEWYKAHPEAAQRWADNQDPEKLKVMRRNANWKYRGIDLTVPEYERRLKEQGGVCALCNEPPISSQLVPDHNHKTGVIRGLIHDFCNRMLGQAKDSPELLELGAQYLRKSRNQCAARAVGGQ